MRQPQLPKASGDSAELRIADGRADLIVHRLPSLPAGRIYEMWVQRGSEIEEISLDIIDDGGVLPRLAAQGYIPAELRDVLRSSTVAMRSAGSGA